MTDLLFVAALLLLLAPLAALSVWIYAPAAGVALLIAACIRVVGEKEP